MGVQEVCCRCAGSVLWVSRRCVVGVLGVFCGELELCRGMLKAYCK